ncbi:hypothetical protein V6N13_002381 [Hibiscus sabdariffa]
MDSGLRAFIPAQFNSFVTVRNHHYLLTEAKRDEVRSYFRNSYSSIARGCLLLSWSFARKDGSKTSDPWYGVAGVILCALPTISMSKRGAGAVLKRVLRFCD